MKRPILNLAGPGAVRRLPGGAGQRRPSPPKRPSADVKTLASDTCEGRVPASAGEEKTLAYLSAQFQAAGL